MPDTVNTRAVSAMNGLVLFMAFLVASAINGSISGIWSLVPFAAAGVLAFASFVKLASACGMNNTLIKGADQVLSVAPVLALAVFGWEAIQFSALGLRGFFAALSLGGIIGAVLFGIADAAKSWSAEKYHRAEASFRPKGVSS